MFFDKNKALLEKRFQIELKPCSANPYSVIETKSRDMAISVLLESKIYTIHSKYDPIKEAERWRNSILDAPGTTYFVYGFGMGYHIEKLLEVCEQDDTVVVIEPSANLFSFSMRYRDFTAIIEDTRVMIYVEPSDQELDFIFFRHISFFDLDRIKFQQLVPYDKLFAEHFETTITKFKKIIAAKKVDLNTTLFFAEQWQKNYVYNLTPIADSAPFSALAADPSFRGKPIVIVAAGPSLDKNVHLLKEIQNKALIICAGSAIRSLNKHNITPHIVVTIDGGEMNAKHFSGLNVSEFHMMYAGTCHPEIPGRHMGPKWYCHLAGSLFDDWLIDKVFDGNIGYVKGGPSVANFCFDIAVQLQGNPICFIGQDLAYTDNRTHAAGSLFEFQRVSADKHDKNKFTIPGYYENEVLTDAAFYSMLKYYENYIHDLRMNGMVEPVIINATEGGARIHGTLQIPFQSFIAEYCNEEFNPKEILLDMYMKYRLPVSAKKKLINNLELYRTEVQKIKDLAKKGRNLAERLLKCYQLNKNSDVQEIIRKLEKIDREIKATESKEIFLSFIMQAGIFKVVKGFQPAPGESEREKGLRISRQSLTLYESLFLTAKEMISVMEDVVKELKQMVQVSDSGSESLSAI